MRSTPGTAQLPSSCQAWLHCICLWDHGRHITPLQSLKGRRGPALGRRRPCLTALWPAGGARRQGPQQPRQAFQHHAGCLSPKRGAAAGALWSPGLHTATTPPLRTRRPHVRAGPCRWQDPVTTAGGAAAHAATVFPLLFYPVRQAAPRSCRRAQGALHKSRLHRKQTGSVRRGQARTWGHTLLRPVPSAVVRARIGSSAE